MDTTTAELQAQFATKVPQLKAELEEWFDEELASIDGSIEAASPSGEGGSILSLRPAIDSKRVVDATVITKRVLQIELSPGLIKPGGYNSCNEMIADLLPKLEKAFVASSIKKLKNAKATVPA